MKSRILVIDDEAEIRRSLRMILEYEGYESSKPRADRKGSRWPNARSPISCSSTSRCRGWTGSKPAADQGSRTRRAGRDDLGPRDREHGGGGDQAGAFDFIEKPLASERVLVTIRNALDRTRLRDENRR